MPDQISKDRFPRGALALGLVCGLLAARGIDAADAEWHVGLARAKITPQEPIAMSGYRQRVSEGVLDDLYAKAMVGEALGPGRLWITAYANESFGYLPTTKILAEGGHETIGLTLDIGLFAPGVEEVVVTTVEISTTAQGGGSYHAILVPKL